MIRKPLYSLTEGELLVECKIMDLAPAMHETSVNSSALFEVCN